MKNEYELWFFLVVISLIFVTFLYIIVDKFDHDPFTDCIDQCKKYNYDYNYVMDNEIEVEYECFRLCSGIRDD